MLKLNLQRFKIFIIFIGLEEHHEQLHWWVICSKVNNVENYWLLNQLKVLQNLLQLELYSEDELTTIKLSFVSWIEMSISKLQNLHKSFCPGSGVIDQAQFTNMLR